MIPFWPPTGPAAAWQTYEPEALRLLVRNADADPPDESGIGNALIDWPVDSDPTTFGDATSDGERRCGVVSGQEAKDWYAALAGANGLTLREGRTQVRGHAPIPAAERASGVPHPARLSPA